MPREQNSVYEVISDKCPLQHLHVSIKTELAHLPTLWKQSFSETEFLREIDAKLIVYRGQPGSVDHAHKWEVWPLVLGPLILLQILAKRETEAKEPERTTTPFKARE